LHLAAAEGEKAVIEVLKAAGVDVAITNNDVSKFYFVAASKWIFNFDFPGRNR
jgi:PHD/YefM family antitoxin component YafN of YafNO toxin-antitoxin module